jgi:pimeloyl-ACP methyl ester carboxylesterase
VSNLPGLLKPFDDVVAIGNSMGGFAAIRFSGFLTKCRQVVAFSPQFSLHPSDIKDSDPRMMSYRSRVTEWQLGNAWSAPNKRARYFIFFGADDAYDAWHAQSFQRVIDERARVFMIGGSDHDVAAMLKRHGVLDTMLDMIINRHCGFEDVERLLKEAGIEVRDSATIEFRPPALSAAEADLALAPRRRSRVKSRPSFDAG